MNSFQLFYVSRLSADLTRAQVRVLAGQAEVLNRRAGIGGSLTFTGRHFAQILEGPRQAVQALAQRIALDARHTHFRIVRQSGERTSPEYRSWGMQLVDSPALDGDIASLLDQPLSAGAADGVLARVKREALWQQGQ